MRSWEGKIASRNMSAPVLLDTCLWYIERLSTTRSPAIYLDDSSTIRPAPGLFTPNKINKTFYNKYFSITAYTICCKLIENAVLLIVWCWRYQHRNLLFYKKSVVGNIPNTLEVACTDWIKILPLKINGLDKHISSKDHGETKIQNIQWLCLHFVCGYFKCSKNKIVS
jgi:hypothetical protein